MRVSVQDPWEEIPPSQIRYKYTRQWIVTKAVLEESIEENDTKGITVYRFELRPFVPKEQLEGKKNYLNESIPSFVFVIDNLLSLVGPKLDALAKSVIRDMAFVKESRKRKAKAEVIEEQQ